MRALRRELAAACPDAGRRAARHLPALDAGIGVVSLYRAQGSEIDPSFIAVPGARIALPVATHRDDPLIFRLYGEGDALEPDAFGIPSPTAHAPQVLPDLVIAPVLAFDRKGGRLGQGAGHYDRTIANLRAIRPILVIGLAFAGQEVEEIPLEPHDERLDAILTENGYIGVE
jgi:5-formyltetrahydrofolate cyclo-ligase